MVDYYSAVCSIRGIGVVLKWSKRPIFSFITIQCIEIKHLFANFFGRCADTLIFNSECYASIFVLILLLFSWMSTHMIFYKPCHITSRLFCWLWSKKHLNSVLMKRVMQLMHHSSFTMYATFPLAFFLRFSLFFCENTLQKWCIKLGFFL